MVNQTVCLKVSITVQTEQIREEMDFLNPNTTRRKRFSFKALLFILGQNMGVVLANKRGYIFALGADMQKPTEEGIVLVTLVTECGNLFKFSYSGYYQKT